MFIVDEHEVFNDFCFWIKMFRNVDLKFVFEAYEEIAEEVDADSLMFFYAAF